MRIEMSQDIEFFKIGSIVCCSTCYNQKIQGEVLAFDEATKMLAIKSQPISGKQNVHDVKMVNLSFVSDIKILNEPDEPPQALTNLNLQKISNRIKVNLEDKRRQVEYIGIGVTSEGQKVFNTIVKTLNDVRWDGKNIVVMEAVTIRPPYGVDDIRGKDGSRILDHVKKIVQNHHKKEETDSRKSMSPSSSVPLV